jgi:hypothetical protein
LIVVLAIVFVGYGMIGRHFAHAKLAHSGVPGYLDNVVQLREEYLKFYGRPLVSAEIEARFSAARKSMMRRDYLGAAVQLDHLASEAAVPVVFNNLALMYANLNDRTRTANAFREALVRDSSHAAVRSNLQRLKCEACGLLARETEPNNLPADANLIPIDTPVDADLNDPPDVDWFKCVTPPTPRDLLTVELTSPSTSLGLTVHLYDSSLRIVEAGKATASQASLLYRLSNFDRNSPFYIRVSSTQGSTGKYLLTVRAPKAFDAYEPNDDIAAAHKISLGDTLNANIMDSHDRDYFSFEKPEAGGVTITIRSESRSFLPVISTFGPDAKAIDQNIVPGRDQSEIHDSLQVRAHARYFIEVWGRDESSGNYSISVR